VTPPCGSTSKAPLAARTGHCGSRRAWCGVVDSRTFVEQSAESGAKIDRIVVDQDKIASPRKDIALDSGHRCCRSIHSGKSPLSASKGSLPLHAARVRQGLDQRRHSSASLLYESPTEAISILVGASTDGAQENPWTEWPFSVQPAFYQTASVFFRAARLAIAILATGLVAAVAGFDETVRHGPARTNAGWP